MGLHAQGWVTPTYVEYVHNICDMGQAEWREVERERKDGVGLVKTIEGGDDDEEGKMRRNRMRRSR
eukprot:766685-Hanusia_phi.AAC.4